MHTKAASVNVLVNIPIKLIITCMAYKTGIVRRPSVVVTAVIRSVELVTFIFKPEKNIRMHHYDNTKLV